ncbi:MAG: chemotaxis protein CheW [Pseudomonadota bacterium]|jgi:purine-binding chemotaxis protein CheW
MSNPSIHPQSASGAMAAEQQYLSFFLAEQEYAVDILRVQEIREWGAVTPVPNTAPFVRGVMNLRGAVVPVIDLRLRMGLPEAAYSTQTVVIVIHVHAEERTRIMGMVVDAVAEVYDLRLDQIRPPPEVTAQGLDNHVSGLIDIEGRMLTLLDFDRMLSIDAMIAPIGSES